MTGHSWLAAWFAVFVAALAPGQDLYDPPFRAPSPRVMGQGGAFVGGAHGYEAMFYNPAGFASEQGSFTLVSSTTWAHARLDEVIAIAPSIDPSNLGQLLGALEQQASSGGLGAGEAIGLGIIARGLGLGAALIVDSYVYAPAFPLGVEEGHVAATFGMVAGLAIPFDVGHTTLRVGASVRPMWRAIVPLTAGSVIGLLTAMTDGDSVLDAFRGEQAFQGVGVGIDIGAITSLGPLNFGVALRDIGGTAFAYSTSTVGGIIDSFGGSANTAVAGGRETVVSSELSFGLALDPDLGVIRYLIDPAIYVDIRDVFAVSREDRSLWTLLSLGAEVRLLSLVHVRAGLNQGYLTVGSGVDLLLLELSVAAYTRELGRQSGDRPSSGVSFELALRI